MTFKQFLPKSTGIWNLKSDQQGGMLGRRNKNAAVHV